MGAGPGKFGGSGNAEVAFGVVDCGDHLDRRCLGGGQKRQDTQGVRRRVVLLLLRQLLPQVRFPAGE